MKHQMSYKFMIKRNKKAEEKIEQRKRKAAV